MWRPEDAGLLSRLEDELVLERLWTRQCPGAPPPHPRAAGLIALLRRTPGGREAVLAALQGDTAALERVLSPETLHRLPPDLLHHLALHQEALAEALAARAPVAALDARVLWMACWLALGDEREYLAAFGRDVIAGAMPDADLARALADAPFEPIHALGRIARASARDQTHEARRALQALERVDLAARRAGCSQELARRARARAEAHRVASADDALAPILEALSEASARGELPARGAELLARTAAVWQWAGEDENVELFAVEQATPIAWEHYREGRWEDLRRLLGPLEPLVDRMASRIEKDPTRIAYAGPCAQMFVFRSEADTEVERQLALAERSLQICPTHRNGRLILANLLCEAAIEAVRARGWSVGEAECDRAAALVDRAEELYPAGKRIPDARARITEARRRVGWLLR